MQSRRRTSATISCAVVSAEQGDSWNKLTSRMPAKKMVSAEESAHLGLYLCSDLTESFYGQVIPPSGGVYR
jgi:enoyl-[acyl-carrier-protein] reductase (NADH)